VRGKGARRWRGGARGSRQRGRELRRIFDPLPPIGDASDPGKHG